MPWVAAFGGEVLMSVGKLTVQVRVDVGAINHDCGVQKRDAFLDNSEVNLMVGWKLLISCRNCWSRSSQALQIAKMSSMKRHHMDGLSVVCCRSCDSSLAMMRLAYEGAILVPIAVPCVCK